MAFTFENVAFIVKQEIDTGAIAIAPRGAVLFHFPPKHIFKVFKTFFTYPVIFVYRTVALMQVTITFTKCCKAKLAMIMIPRIT